MTLRDEGRSDLRLNTVGRNAVWSYPRVVAPRFKGAHVMVETARSYEIPDFDSLPEGSEVVVELYGGAVSYRLDGKKRRVYVTRFDWIPFSSESSARQAFLDLWETLRGLDSVAAVEKAAHAWAKRVRSQPAAC